MSKYNVHIYVEDVSVEAVFNKIGGVSRAKRLLADELMLVEAPKPELIPESPPNFIVRVDRLVKPTYPDWFKKLAHPEFECSGPTEYNLQDGVEQWLASGQEGVSNGDCIYAQLKSEGALASCLNLQDGLVIQQKGIVVFRILFADKVFAFLWGSVAQDNRDDLVVPFLYDNVDRVGLSWSLLGDRFDSSNPALRFRKQHPGLGALWFF